MRPYIDGESAYRASRSTHSESDRKERRTALMPARVDHGAAGRRFGERSRCHAGRSGLP